MPTIKSGKELVLSSRRKKTSGDAFQCAPDVHELRAILMVSFRPALIPRTWHPSLFTRALPESISVSRALSLASRSSGAELQDACRKEGLERARNGLMQMTLAAKEKEGYPPINRGTAMYPVSRSPLDTCRGAELLL